MTTRGSTYGDTQAVAGAQRIVTSGLGYEGWMDLRVEVWGTKSCIDCRCRPRDAA